MRYQLTPINTRPWLLNGLSQRLIESHYENHYGGALRKLNAITEQLESRDFGTVDRWRSEFVAMAKGLAGGSGWVLLVYVPRDRRLINQYSGDHGQATAGGIPILALDMYEHAYHIDFGANATAYIDTFQRTSIGSRPRRAM